MEYQEKMEEFILIRNEMLKIKAEITIRKLELNREKKIGISKETLKSYKKEIKNMKNKLQGLEGKEKVLWEDIKKIRKQKT